MSAATVLRGARFRTVERRIGALSGSSALDESAVDGGPTSLETAREAARSDGFAQGFEQGRIEGRAEGLRLGRIQGEAQGRSEAQAQAHSRLDEALADARRQLQQDQDRWRDLLASLTEQKGGWAAVLEDELAVICTAAVARCVGKAVLRPGGIRSIVRQVLSQAQGQEGMTLRLHPLDIPLVQEATAAGAKSAVRLLADPAIRTGGCLLQTAAGDLDARLDRLLEEIRSEILQARARRRGEPA